MGNTPPGAAGPGAPLSGPAAAAASRASLARRNTGDVVQSIIAKGPIATRYDVDYKTVLGKGHYAIVNPARNRETGEEVAVKRIQIARSRLEALKLEITVLLEVGKHPNIVELKDVFLTETEVQLVMELLRGGELFDRMVERGPYSEAEASRHVRKIGEALQYLHGKGIVHRDLKPENLILTDKSDHAELKIADFGLSKIVEDIASSTMATACGTWAYAAPEVRGPGAFQPPPPPGAPPLAKPSYTAKVDIWSLGVILYVILAAYHPFDPDGQCTDAQLWQNITSGRFTFEDPVWNGISDGAKHLISNLIVVDPERRYSTAQLLAHPWITQSADVPSTPITPRIDSSLQSFAQRGKYSQKLAGIFSMPVPSMPSIPSMGGGSGRASVGGAGAKVKAPAAAQPPPQQQQVPFQMQAPLPPVPLPPLQTSVVGGGGLGAPPAVGGRPGGTASMEVDG